MTERLRKLFWSNTSWLTGWSCTVCGWARPLPRCVESNDPGADIKRAFNDHDCTKYPTKIRWTREGADS
jgi:hypothetical protein